MWSQSVKLIYIEAPSLVLALNDALDIEAAWKVRRNKRLLPCVQRIPLMIATPSSRPRLTDHFFETDGLGCIRLLLWLMDQHPTSRPSGTLNRFMALFDHNPVDALSAPMRIILNAETSAAGENQYFINQQWLHHPTEMAALKALGSF
jgi:hypothetical protein